MFRIFISTSLLFFFVSLSSIQLYAARLSSKGLLTPKKVLELVRKKDRTVIPILGDFIKTAPVKTRIKYIKAAYRAGWIKTEPLLSSIKNIIKNPVEDFRLRKISLNVLFLTDEDNDKIEFMNNLIKDEGFSKALKSYLISNIAYIDRKEGLKYSENLLALLNEESTPLLVRKNSAITIGKLRVPKTQKTLEKLLLTEKDSRIIASLCEGLGYYGTKLSNSQIKEIISKTKFPSLDVQEKALIALGNSNNLLALRELYDIYRSIGTSDIFIPALKTITLDSILNICKVAKSEKLKKLSVKILLRLLGTPEASTKINLIRRILIKIGRNNLSELRIALSSVNHTKRLNVIYILGRIKDEESLDRLKEIYETSKDEYESKLALQSLNLIKYGY